MASENNFSDIQIKTWFDRFLPVIFYHYARLARWDRPVGVWLLFLPCLWGVVLGLYQVDIGFTQAVKLSALFLVGSLVMRGAGCTINDLWDVDLDAQVERTQNRPLASGALSKKQALGFLILQCLIGAVILLQFNFTTVVLGLFSLPLIVLYPLMKRITWWPQLFLGVTFNWGILMGWSALGLGFQWGVVLLYGAAVFWTLAYDTIYAFQDISDDAVIGVKSTARLFKSNAKIWCSGFYTMMLIGFLSIGFLEEAHISFYSLIVLVMGAHFLNLWKKWDMNDQRSSLKAFKYHIMMGWGVLLVFASNLL